MDYPRSDHDKLVYAYTQYGRIGLIVGLVLTVLFYSTCGLVVTLLASVVVGQPVTWPLITISILSCVKALIEYHAITGTSRT